MIAYIIMRRNQPVTVVLDNKYIASDKLQDMRDAEYRDTRQYYESWEHFQQETDWRLRSVKVEES